MISRFNQFNESNRVGEFPKFEDILIKSKSLKYKEDVMDLLDQLSDSDINLYKISEGYAFISKSKGKIIFKFSFNESNISEDGGIDEFIKANWERGYKIVEGIHIGIRDGDDIPHWGVGTNDSDYDDEEIKTIENLDKDISKLEDKFSSIENHYQKMKKRMECERLFFKSLQRIKRLDNDIHIESEYSDSYNILFL